MGQLFSCCKPETNRNSTRENRTHRSQTNEERRVASNRKVSRNQNSFGYPSSSYEIDAKPRQSIRDVEDVNAKVFDPRQDQNNSRQSIANQGLREITTQSQNQNQLHTSIQESRSDRWTDYLWSNSKSGYSSAFSEFDAKPRQSIRDVENVNAEVFDSRQDRNNFRQSIAEITTQSQNQNQLHKSTQKSRSDKWTDYLWNGDEFEISPENIRFSQDEIFYKFQARSHEEMVKIEDVLSELLAGKIKVTDFPRITVTLKDNLLYTLDNRRLWIFKEYQKRKGNFKITVKFRSYNTLGNEANKFTTKNNGASIAVVNSKTRKTQPFKKRAIYN